MLKLSGLHPSNGLQFIATVEPCDLEGTGPHMSGGKAIGIAATYFMVLVLMASSSRSEDQNKTSKGNVNLVSSHVEPSQSLEGKEDSRTAPPKLSLPKGCHSATHRQFLSWF